MPSKSIKIHLFLYIKRNIFNHQNNYVKRLNVNIQCILRTKQISERPVIL